MLSGMAKKSAYIETTVFSFYHDERPSCAYQRTVTREWWATQSARYRLATSYLSVAEVSNPVYPGWEQVRALALSVPMLADAPELKGIVRVYLDNRLMPQDDAGDALHLAIASFHRVDYLVTWNCRHLANANKFEHVRSINMRLGLLTPAIVTPAQLFEEG
jgi:predicted nucleic acid-binding protein